MQRMTEEEIRRDLRLCKNEQKQIKILAEMNATMPKVIKRIRDGQIWEEAEARRRRKTYYIPKGKYKHWTVGELKELKEMQKNHVPQKEIAKRLNRSLGSIHGAVNYIRKKEGEKDDLGRQDT